MEKVQKIYILKCVFKKKKKNHTHLIKEVAKPGIHQSENEKKKKERIFD